jgi:hypothetical protein
MASPEKEVIFEAAKFEQPKEESKGQQKNEEEEDDIEIPQNKFTKLLNIDGSSKKPSA